MIPGTKVLRILDLDTILARDLLTQLGEQFLDPFQSNGKRLRPKLQSVNYCS
jgi:hypothetical protein